MLDRRRNRYRGPDNLLWKDWMFEVLFEIFFETRNFGKSFRLGLVYELQ